MRNRLILAALFAVPAMAAAEPRVLTADGSWANLPQLKEVEPEAGSYMVAEKLWQIASRKQCTLPGLTKHRLRFNMSFAVQYAPDGTLGQVVLPKLNCAEAESLLGRSVIEMIETGALQRVPANSDGWYRGTLSFQIDG